MSTASRPRKTPVKDRVCRDSARTTVVMTGFGPFPGVPVNATMLLVPRLAVAARAAFPGTRIVCEILPTEWRAAPQRVDRLLATHQPDLVLHFGVSGRARGFEIETRGHNVCAMAPDAAGRTPGKPLIAEGGALRLPARVPVAAIVRRLRQRRIPAFQSWSAGDYLCNATLYHVLAATTGSACEAGFIHIPSLLAPPGRSHMAGAPLRCSPGCPMNWQQALEGALEIVAACLGRNSPRVVKSAPAFARHG